jgi:hypothetical protein
MTRFTLILFGSREKQKGNEGQGLTLMWAGKGLDGHKLFQRVAVGGATYNHFHPRDVRRLRVGRWKWRQLANGRGVRRKPWPSWAIVMSRLDQPWNDFPAYWRAKA